MEISAFIRMKSYFLQSFTWITMCIFPPSSLHGICVMDISPPTLPFVEWTLKFWCNQRIRKFRLHETFYYWWNGRKPWNLNIAQCTFAIGIASHQNKHFCSYSISFICCYSLLYCGSSCFMFFYWTIQQDKTTIGSTVGCYTAAATACRGRERAALQHQRRFYFNEK